jgi:hypothetical protein
MDAREIYSASNFEREEHGEGHEDTEYISSISDGKEKDMSKIQSGLETFSPSLCLPMIRKRLPRYATGTIDIANTLASAAIRPKIAVSYLKTNDCHHQPHFLSTREPNGQPVPAITHLTIAKVSATMESRRVSLNGSTYHSFSSSSPPTPNAHRLMRLI